jgi:hypothetical protein
MSGSSCPSQGSSGTPIFKTWGFWLGIVVLLGGFVLYVRTWTRASRLDFTPETNPPPSMAQPTQPQGNPARQ